MSEKAIGIISANYQIEGFGPLLKNRTLSTLPFGARYRMIDFALSNFTNAGIHTVGVITPYYYRSLLDHISDGKPWDLARVHGGLFILPGTVYGEGMGKNRFPLKDLIRNQRILRSGDAKTVILCDTSCVLNADLNAFVEAHEKSRCRVTFMYKKMQSQPGRAVLGIENGFVKSIEESGGAEGDVFLGVMAISRDYLLELLEDYATVDYLDIFTVFRLDLGRHRINTYEFGAYAGLVDTIEDYVRISGELITQKTSMELFEGERPIYTKPQDAPPCRYKKGASVKNSIIASGSVIEGTVENSIIFRSVTVGKGAVIRNAIIMQHSRIGENAVVENAILDKNVTVGSEKKICGTPEDYVVLAKETIV